ncbi:hypothetical protein HPB47_012052, partial [Ixodes persulcatus]
VKQMNQQLANLSKFVAKPCPTSRPFTAKLKQKHTVPDKVQLHSTTRAQRRHDFDSALSSRIRKRTAESEERKRAEEEAAIRELRRKTVFRANPMPRPKPPAARAAKRAAPRADTLCLFLATCTEATALSQESHSRDEMIPATTKSDMYIGVRIF